MSKIKLTPLHDRIIIEPAQSEEKTESGIIIPDSAKEKPQKGKVLAVGTNESLTVKVGDTIIYGKHAGTEIEIDNAPYLIMRESEILAIL